MEVTPKQFTLIFQLFKPEIEPLHPIFKDIEALINARSHFPIWGEVYRIFRQEYCLDIVPPSDPHMINTDDFVFVNITRSHLHTIPTRTLFMLCSKAIEWVINHTDVDNIVMLIDEGRCIASYQPLEIEKYYRLHQPKKYMITGFVEKIHRENNIKKILES